jgi:hemolysin activation/secretion protein
MKQKKNRPAFYTSAFLLAGWWLSLPAHAASIPLPASAEPGRVSAAFTAETLQPQTRAAAPAINSDRPPQALKPEMENIQFKLVQIVIDNAQVYSEKQLRSLYQDKLNTLISIGALQNIVQDITNYYRNHGYILSRAVLPPQRIADGTVHIRIVEGYIDHGSVAGDPKGARALVQTYVDKITTLRPLQIHSLERYLRLANDLPGVDIKAVLEPSPTTTGAAELTATTRLKPFAGFISYDNYGTRFSGPMEITAGAEADSIFRSGDKTQLTVAGTDRNEELRYIDINHDTPLGSEGMRLTLGGNYAETQPGFTLAPLAIQGRAKTAYAAIKYPLLLARAEELDVSGGFNYMDSAVNTLGVPLYTDHIRKATIGGAYDFADRFSGANLLGVTMSQGLNVMGATPLDDQNVSRLGGHSQFTKFNVQATRTQSLPGAFSAFATVQGQYAFVPLLASEQFGFGGQQIGRAYDPSEIIGDKGVAGSFEVRYDAAPYKSFLQAVQFYTFYDAGVVWNINASSLPGKASAAATGLGMRLYFTHHLSGNLLLAQPLTRPVAAEDISGNGKAPRAYFGLTATM